MPLRARSADSRPLVRSHVMKIVRRGLRLFAVALLVALASSVAACSSADPCSSAGRHHLASWATRVQTPNQARLVRLKTPGCFRDSSHDVAFDIAAIHFRAKRHRVSAVRRDLVKQLSARRWRWVKAWPSKPTFTRREGNLTLWAIVESSGREVYVTLNDGEDAQ